MGGGGGSGDRADRSTTVAEVALVAVVDVVEEVDGNDEGVEDGLLVDSFREESRCKPGDGSTFTGETALLTSLPIPLAFEV